VTRQAKAAAHEQSASAQKTPGIERRKEQFMTHFPIWRASVRSSSRSIIALSLVLGAAACSETGEFMVGSRDAAAAGPAPIGATRQLERDVEAPEVFDVTAEGLWDGRPSLGGVWVAHPDATDPERVMIRNVETGRFVIGALFRRERENPGPLVQISSDAAAALDILAGAPAMVQVTALRREEVADTEAPVAEAIAAETDDVLAEAETSVDVATIAAAAIATQPETATEPADTAARPLFRPFAGAAPAVPAVVEIPRNMSAEDVMAGITRAAFQPDELMPAAPAPAPSLEAMAEAAITETTLAPTAAVAPLEIAALSAPLPAAAPASEDVAAAPVSVPAAAPAAPLPERSYVQIGLFSVQENANNTGQTLRNAGLVPTIHDETSNGRRFWRVVVGPAPTAEDRAAVLDTVRGLGFEDAYFVAR
jgi:rare lipoprotein A